jgi:multidrug efflux pump subunit AcrA (membrane-fusion protein)
MTHFHSSTSRAVLLATAFLILFLSWPTWSQEAAPAQPAAAKTQPPSAETDPPQPLKVLVRLEVLERASITAQRDGYISVLPIKMGGNVAADQVVARFDEKITAAQVRVAQNELQQLRLAGDNFALEDSFRVQRDAAMRELDLLQKADRQLQAAYDGGGVTETEFLRLQATIDQADAELRDAESQRKQSGSLAAAKQAELEIAQHELSVSRIKAPFPGTVSHIARYRGSWIKAGEPLAELVRMDKMIATLSVHQNQVPAHRITGATADVRFAGVNAIEQNFVGHVVRVLPKVDSDGVYLAFMEIDNEQAEDLSGQQQWLLRPGMTGQATVHLETSPSPSDVARQALREARNPKTEIRNKSESPNRK